MRMAAMCSSASEKRRACITAPALSLALALAALILLFCMPALGNDQVLALGNCSLTLDFGGQDVAVRPMPPEYEECVGTSTEYIMMVDNGTGSSSFAYLIDLGRTHPAEDSGKDLLGMMRSMSDDASILQYEGGYISSGHDRLGGQEIWGLIRPLDVSEGKFTTYLEIIATFGNGTLNEHLVKTAKIQCSGTPFSVVDHSGHEGCSIPH
jgi:hypothetical protein